MTTLPPPDSPLELQRQELAALIQRHAGQPHGPASAIEDLYLTCYEEEIRGMPALAQPALCILAQGSKTLILGDEHYAYDPLHYMVVSVTLPISGALLKASPEHPALGLRLDIDPAQLSQLIAESSPMVVPNRPSGLGLYVEKSDPQLLDALIRLIKLLDSPRDIAILAPMIRREIFYRLLRGPQGYRLYEIALANSQTHRVCQAITWLNNHYHQPLRIEDLAREVNLSVSTLHHRFKSVTSMSPLQYQKQLRLQEARRLMFNEGLEAAVAGYRVGYESPSQFSREYSRLYGAPPIRDVARLRASAS
ncbi:AraC family transcriptional regulator [Pseudomonas sp. B21-023]|uniref:AraC family transcriptional regulator n=1 Tax=unclassified Pseudomonas TaxID=196821 RepID=UPI00111ADD9B|nr:MULTISPECIES: AraC family transcriptional regulator [unclassified Pseudomonas]MBI6954652.1 AraC family transcriptional regulator [Pseudomonas sp. CCOS 191]UVL18304.1 AraC family transcriptional regulator [Pseudomonas sp. B21-044]UVM15712.1 AraC family transcriptional regulator [Pseudomonas sp. B21-023]